MSHTKLYSSYVNKVLPVQRIACRAAHAVMPVDFGHIRESVFVSCPLPIHFYL